MNIVGFAGYSGSGKTTLLEKLIPALKQRGLRTTALTSISPAKTAIVTVKRVLMK